MDKGKQVAESGSSGIFSKFKPWGKKKANVEIIDMEQQFELLSKVFKNMKTRKFYGKCSNRYNKVLKLLSDERVSCTDENQEISFSLAGVIDFPYNSSVEYVHLGAIIIGVKGLQRSSPGAKTLVVLYDTRFINAEQGVIGSCEIDMSTTNGGIIYLCPKFPMDPAEFRNNIKVGIKTKGYVLQEGAENIMMRTGFIGSLCISSPSPSCKISEEKMEEILVGKGIKAVRGSEYTALQWNLETFFQQQTIED